MSEGGNEGGGGGVGGRGRKVVMMALFYTAIVMALGLGITLTFGADKRTGALFTYVYHSLFYSACLGALLAMMFHAAEEH